MTLTGAVPSVASAQELTKLRAVSPLDKRPRSARSQSDGVIVEGAVRLKFTLWLPQRFVIRGLFCPLAWNVSVIELHLNKILLCYVS